jgi:hypothetical protein
MAEQQDRFLIEWWSNQLEELDREIARLALLCEVRILDPGVVTRVLQKDASVCRTDNPIAFEKLRKLLMMYFAIHEKSADALGPELLAVIEADIIQRLSKSFPDMGKWPPG